MSTVEIQVMTDESEKVVTENIVSEMHSQIMTEALVALSEENIEASLLAKGNSSADSGILMSKSNSDVSDSANEKNEESASSTQTSVEEHLSAKNSATETEDQQSQKQNNLSLDSKCSQESKATSSSYSTKSSCKSSSTLKSSQSISDHAEDSHSSISSSTSTIKASQHTNDRSDDESNSRSSFSSVSKTSSPKKQSDAESTLKKSQSVNKNLTDDEDSQSTITRSHSKPTPAHSQSVDDRSNDESTFKRSQSANTNLTEDDNSHVNDKSDNENNSRCSKKSTSEKQNENKKPRKYFAIVDSDSEDDIIMSHKINNKEKDTDSDSRMSESVQSSKKKLKIKKSKVKNKMQLIDSDSDEESEKIKENKSDEDNDSDRENKDSKSPHKSNKISNLIDSDSESGSDNGSQKGGNISSGEENNGNAKNGKQKPEKKRAVSARASKDIAMQQIHSETQRLIRESHVSLPYHRPKQRTLEEFLNRKKMTSSIPKNLTCAEKVKMFPEIISKIVEEKEKEAELFYKSSDSEEDDEDEPMEVDQTNTENEKSNGDEKQTEAVNISDTQKLSQDHIQEIHNKREVLQRRSADFGVPRKLFMEDANDMEETDNVKTSEGCLDEDENLDPNVAAMKKKNREVKTGLRESSVPRKLFGDGTEEMEVDMDIDANKNDKSVSEKQIEDNKKSSENSEKVVELSEDKTVLDDSTEEIVLKLPESDSDISDDKKTMDLNKRNEEINQSKNQESIMISDTPIISNKELIKTRIVSHESKSIKNSEDTSDPILKLAKEPLKEDEIIDYNVLREDFGRLPELDEPVQKPSLKKQILANVLKIKPTIKASPGSVIDLTNSKQLNEGVTKLFERFARHCAVHRPKADTVSEVKVIRTEGTGDDIKVIEEIIPFKIDVIEDDPKKECKPGEKLKKLREDLKRQIAIVRDEEWRQKEEMENEDEEIETTKSKCDDFYKDLPDEEELLDDEESAESEPEENDMPIVESRRKTCEFGDEEAEESENEDDEDIEAVENGNDEDENEDEDEEEEEEEENEEDEDTEIEQEEEEKEPNKPKILKRIIRPIDEEDESSQSNDAEAKLTFDRSKTDEDMFASQASKGSASDPDDIPPFQPRDRCYSDSRSQACKTPLLKPSNILSMISPVAQLTALNTSSDSTRKSASKTTTFNFGNLNANSAENTPVAESRSQSNCSMEKMNSLQKKLFDDPPESVHDSELLEVCSGRFTETQSSQPPSIDTQSDVTDSQILDICSGAFATQVGVAKNGVTDSQLMDICSEAFGTQANEANKIESINFKHPSAVTDSQIMHICSGNFVTQNGKSKTDEPISPNLPGTDETSQDITLTLDDDENSKSSPTKMSTATKRSDESMFSSDSKSPDQSLAVTTTTNTTATTTTATTTSTTKTTTSPKKNSMASWLQKGLKPTVIPVQRENEKVSETQLMDLCSGPFVTQSKNIQKFGEDKLSHIQNENSQDFRLTLDDESNNIPSKKSPQKPKTKKPEILVNKEAVKEQPKPASSNLRIVFSSDEDEDDKAKIARLKKKVLKKKKVQKLDLSDDEDDNPKEYSDGEDSEIEEEEDEEKFVDYDSEENEVVVVPKKEIKKVAAKYLENEAELSESDWDSADEDEQDLDKLEYEEADAEDIDEDKMKNQLDKIHMKQMMDEDQRDVRMLQELLFDDGDLHSEGAGRERRFKWKNIDDMGEDELKPSTDDDSYAIDDEVDTTHELQMRKMRYEQQKFLEEKEKTIQNKIDDDFGDGKFLKGLKVVSVRSTSKTSVNEQKIVKNNSVGVKSITITNNLIAKKTFMSSKSLSFGNMKGSFLARGDETLVRIAQNLPETSKGSVKGRKGKFVFAHLSPSVSTNPQVDSDAENDATPAKEKNQRKRKMFSSQNSQTPRTTKKAKVEDRAAGKKLF